MVLDAALAFRILTIVNSSSSSSSNCKSNSKSNSKSNRKRCNNRGNWTLLSLGTKGSLDSLLAVFFGSPFLAVLFWQSFGSGMNANMDTFWLLWSIGTNFRSLFDCQPIVDNQNERNESVFG